MLLVTETDGLNLCTSELANICCWVAKPGFTFAKATWPMWGRISAAPICCRFSGMTWLWVFWGIGTVCWVARGTTPWLFKLWLICCGNGCRNGMVGTWPLLRGCTVILFTQGVFDLSIFGSLQALMLEREVIGLVYKADSGRTTEGSNVLPSSPVPCIFRVPIIWIGLPSSCFQDNFTLSAMCLHLRIMKKNIYIFYNHSVAW